MLEGVNVYVTKKCAVEQEDIALAVTSLGGAVSCGYNPDEVTHVIFVGRQNDTAKEFRQAKKDGKTIVCPAWAYMCRDEGRRQGLLYSLKLTDPLKNLTVSILLTGWMRRCSRTPTTPR